MANTCPNLFLIRTDAVIIPIRCGQWTCPHCRQVLARQWAARTYEAIKATDGAYFLTFTLWGNIASPTEGYRKIPKLWDRLRKKFQRRLDDWTYIAFCEGQTKTRGGMPHFHVLTDQYPFTARVKDLAVSCGFGYEAEKEAVSERKAAYYVSKYVSKGDPAIPKGFRRVRTSQDFPKLPETPPPAPVIVRARNESEFDYLVRCSIELHVPVPLLEAAYRRVKIGFIQ